MKKKKTIVVISLCLVFVFIASVGAYFTIRRYKKDNIDFTIEDTLPEGSGKSARVILLAGQSNASGCSLNEYLERNVPAEKYAEYAAGYDNVYINYFSSGNNISGGFVRTSTNQGENDRCFGPETGLAESLDKARPDELFFIIKFAWGGTDLFSQWLSPSSEGKTGYLYRNFIRYVKKSMRYLLSKGYDVSIEGVCWMQGESDSFSEENAAGYEKRLMNFIEDLRKDLSEYSPDSGIAFIDACIADNPVFWVYCELVNASKQAVADASEKTVLIDTNAQGLLCDKEPEGNPDIPHYDSMSEIKLGNLFGEEIIKFLE